MIVLEIDEVEVDHCVACGGTWLDAGELELLLDGAEHKERLLSTMEPGVTAGEKPRRCPICTKKMQKVRCGSHERVMIDKCKANDGLWFDRGELRDIVAMGGFPGENRVYELLNVVFGDTKQ
jgi:Zn-finger nucleic acid-binding protein